MHHPLMAAQILGLAHSMGPIQSNISQVSQYTIMMTLGSLRPKFTTSMLITGLASGHDGICQLSSTAPSYESTFVDDN